MASADHHSYLKVWDWSSAGEQNLVCVCLCVCVCVCVCGTHFWGSVHPPIIFLTPLSKTKLVFPDSLIRSSDVSSHNIVGNVGQSSTSVQLFLDITDFFCKCDPFFTLCWFICFHPCNSCSCACYHLSCVLCVPTFFLVTAALSSFLFFLGISFACFLLLAFWILGFETWKSAHHYGIFDQLWQSNHLLTSEKYFFQWI